MKLVIAGSRTVRPSLSEIDEAIERWACDPGFEDLPFAITLVISGCAPGADQAGENWAIQRGKPLHREPITDADMASGKYLGPRHRNRRMAELGDAGLLFWDGISGGTADMAIRLLARGKPVRVIPTRKYQRNAAPTSKGTGIPGRRPLGG